MRDMLSVCLCEDKKNKDIVHGRSAFHMHYIVVFFFFSIFSYVVSCVVSEVVWKVNSNG